MPTVDGTKFPYTKEGIRKAKAWSEMTGKPIKYPKFKSKKLKERKSKNWTGTKTEAELFKEGRIGAAERPKIREKKYQGGGNILDIVKGLEDVKQQRGEMAAMKAPPTQLERYGEPKTFQKPSDEEMEMMANLVMGSLGGGGKSGLAMLKKFKNVKAKDFLKARDKILRQERDRLEFGSGIDFDKVPNLTIGDMKKLKEYKKLFEEQIVAPAKAAKAKKAQGGDIPEYGFGGWLKKRVTPSKKAKKWWNKNIKPLGKIRFNDLNPYDNKQVATKDKGPIDPNLFGARQKFGSGSNLQALLGTLGATQDLQPKNLQSLMEGGGAVPAGRRKYNMGGGRKKRKK